MSCSLLAAFSRLFFSSSTASLKSLAADLRSLVHDFVEAAVIKSDAQVLAESKLYNDGGYEHIPHRIIAVVISVSGQHGIEVKQRHGQQNSSGYEQNLLISFPL